MDNPMDNPMAILLMASRFTAVNSLVHNLVNNPAHPRIRRIRAATIKGLRRRAIHNRTTSRKMLRQYPPL